MTAMSYLTWRQPDFQPDKNKIIEIGAVKVVDGAITERFSTFVNPEVPIRIILSS